MDICLLNETEKIKKSFKKGLQYTFGLWYIISCRRERLRETHIDL